MLLEGGEQGAKEGHAFVEAVYAAADGVGEDWGDVCARGFVSEGDVGCWGGHGEAVGGGVAGLGVGVDVYVHGVVVAAEDAAAGEGV